MDVRVSRLQVGDTKKFSSVSMTITLTSTTVRYRDPDLFQASVSIAPLQSRNMTIEESRSSNLYLWLFATLNKIYYHIYTYS